jgi:fructose-bisphosphate aldolase class 1
MSEDLQSVAATLVADRKGILAADENVKPGQQALYHRARCNAAATLGKYTDEMEA